MARSEYIDHGEIFDIFTLLLDRGSQKKYSIVPILSLVGPPGSGKTTLIEHVIERFCTQNGALALPYAYVDFTTDGAPKDLFQILVQLHDQLCQREDSNKKRLVFPRFDVASVLASARRGASSSSLSAEDQQQEIKKFTSLIGPLGEGSNALGNALPFIPPLYVVLRWVEEHWLQDLAQNITRGAIWKWYKKELKLPEDTPIKTVLQVLSDTTNPSQKNRQILIDLLIAAFFEDLRDAMNKPNPASLSQSIRVILFLDGFEALLDNQTDTGSRLLEILALAEQRKSGEASPLLLVIASQQRLEPLTTFFIPPRFVSAVTPTPVPLPQRFTNWEKHLPHDSEYLRLEDLLLECWLDDFSREDSERYVQSWRTRQTQPLDKGDINMRTIYDQTHGHPLSLQAVLSVIADRRARRQLLTPGALKKAAIDALTRNKFLNRLSDMERNNLTLCAAPRLLDIDILHAILLRKYHYDADVQNRWEIYRKMSIFYPLDDDKLMLHPIVRAFLLRNLRPRRVPNSDYYQTHESLRDLFRSRATQGDVQALREVIYHTLALGDSKPAIELAIAAQQDASISWNEIIETVQQAPTGLMNKQETEHEASLMLNEASEQQDIQKALSAVLLYIWLLSEADDEPMRIVHLQYQLGKAYAAVALSAIQPQDQRTNLQIAIALYKDTLNAGLIDDQSLEYAEIKFDLGEAYAWLLNRELLLSDQLRKDAQACYLDAFGIFSRERRIDRVNTVREKLTQLDQWKSVEIPTTASTTLPLPSAATEPITLPPAETAHIPPSPFNKPRHAQQLSGAGTKKKISIPVVILLLLLAIIAVIALPLTLIRNAGPSSVAPTPHTFPRGIGVFPDEKNENIGISDGSYALDVGPDRAGSKDKADASAQLRAGNIGAATALWHSALSQDSSDAEVLIYLEDQNVIASKQPYFTIVIGTVLSDNPVDYASRDQLQGAYVAQHEYNEQAKRSGVPLLRLLIAKSGNNSTNSIPIAQQVVQAANFDKTIIGVFGWTKTNSSIDVLPILADAHIPVLASAAGGDDLSGRSPFFFRVSPPNKVQAQVLVKYAETQLHPQRLVVFVDPNDAFSQSFKDDFTRQFTADGYKTLMIEKYTTASSPEAMAQLVLEVLSHNPDAIFFAGSRATDIGNLLKAIPSSPQFANLKVLTDSTVYPIVDAPEGVYEATTRLRFVSAAFPDEWSILEPGQPAPLFFTEYPAAFDPYRQHQGNPYGFIRSDAYVMLAYDSIMVLMQGVRIAIDKSGRSITGSNLQQALSQMNSNRPVQGITGQISFNNDHDPQNKEVFVLRKASGGLQLDHAEGCFLIQDCSSSAHT